MKNFFFLLSFLICALNIDAQDYKLTFSLEGEVNSIDSVIVENVTQNTRIKLNGNDTLILTKTITGLNTIKDSGPFLLKAFPNPASSTVNLQFTTGKSENIVARIFDIEGREIVNERWNVTQGIHIVRLKNLPTGIFVVRISSGSNSEQIKIASLQEGKNYPEITGIYSEQVPNIRAKTKSATEARLMDYVAYDNIVVRVCPFDAPWELKRGFVMPETDPLPEEKKTFVFEYVECKDTCGNFYNTVQIGDQIWMAENFRCFTDSSWVYDNDENNEAFYGRLYAWEDALNNAPEGWHLPTDLEWDEMEDYLQNTYEDKVPLALKSKTGWLPTESQNNTNGNDASGFNMMPGGARWYLNGSFYAAGERAYFWTATKADSIRATMRKFTSSDSIIGAGYSNMNYGFSVRYVKDKPVN